MNHTQVPMEIKGSCTLQKIPDWIVLVHHFRHTQENDLQFLIPTLSGSHSLVFSSIGIYLGSLKTALHQFF